MASLNRTGSGKRSGWPKIKMDEWGTYRIIRDESSSPAEPNTPAEPTPPEEPAPAEPTSAERTPAELTPEESTPEPTPEPTPEKPAQEKSTTKNPTPEEPRPKYKSWKKKYRKMKLQFEQKMRESDQLFREEQELIEETKLLAQENDQILELLLDLNDSTHIPARKRFDLGSVLDDSESLESPDAVSRPGSDCAPFSPPSDTQSKKRSSRSTTKAKREKDAAAAAADSPKQPDPTRPKSFKALLASVPHTRSLAAAETYMAEELCTDPPPPTYFTPSQEEEYLASVDAALESNPSVNPFLNPKPASTDREKERELSLRNPVSVYNWLRRHQPQVFLQDNEGTPEKTGMKSSRGAGKRASAAAARNNLSEQHLSTMADFMDDTATAGDGYSPAPNTGPTKTAGSKRKREKDDDAGYRPKGGSGGGNGGAAKRKRESEPGGGGIGGATKKARRTTGGGGTNGS